MKRRRFAGLLMVLMLLTLTACGSSATSNHAAADTAPGESVSHSASGGAVEEESMEMGYLSDMAAPEAMEEPEKSQDVDSTGVPSGQKLIRNAWLELESTEFDEASQALKELTEAFGGYFENSSVANYKDGARWGD